MAKMSRRSALLVLECRRMIFEYQIPSWRTPFDKVDFCWIAETACLRVSLSVLYRIMVYSLMKYRIIAFCQIFLRTKQEINKIYIDSNRRIIIKM